MGGAVKVYVDRRPSHATDAWRVFLTTCGAFVKPVTRNTTAARVEERRAIRSARAKNIQIRIAARTRGIVALRSALCQRFADGRNDRLVDAMKPPRALLVRRSASSRSHAKRLRLSVAGSQGT
jgi:hypothetical protein